MTAIGKTVNGQFISIERVQHEHGKYAVSVPAGTAHFKDMEDAVGAWQYACEVARVKPVVIDVPHVENETGSVAEPT